MATTIKIRRDTAARWAANNPTPKSGELCIVTDATPQRMKIGDGLTAFNSLPYFTLPNATNSVAGLLTPADKGKLDDILNTVALAVGESVRVTFSIPTAGEYTLCDSGEMLLMVVDGKAYTTPVATLGAGEVEALFVFATAAEIPADAFKKKDVVTAHIPSYVHKLGEGAFSDNALLTTIDCEGMTPPACAGAFENVDLGSATLVVHDVVKSLYEGDGDWGQFATIIDYSQL